MASLTRRDRFRWDPFQEMEAIRERFGRLLSPRPASRDVGRGTMTVVDWVPAVDVTEDEKEYLIKAEIPEVDWKDIKVTIQDGALTIQAVRRKEIEEKSRRFHRFERARGSFLRSLVLPDNAVGDRQRTEFRDGMLRVHLPKAERSKPKALDVRDWRSVRES